MRDELVQARERYLHRMAVYRSFGYDRLMAVRFIVDRAEPLSEPALDVGTGKGLLAIELARRGLNVASVDVSDEEQHLAALNAELEGVADRIAFHTADARSIPFPDATFGCAATMDALHHLAEGPAVFLEMVRVVKPGGRIVVAEFSAEGFALVERVHQSEGRHHERGAVTMEAAREWFLGRGLRLETTSDGHLHTVVVFLRAV